MKKYRRLIALVAVITLISALFLTACGGSKGGSSEPEAAPTLESFMNEHPDVLEDIEEKLASDETAGIKVEVKGNDLIYSYDIGNIEDVTEEFAKSDDTKKSLTDALNDQADNFKGVASSIESIVNEAGVKIEGVQVVVNYTYGDEVIASGTFKPDPEAAADQSSDDEGDN